MANNKTIIRFSFSVIFYVKCMHTIFFNWTFDPSFHEFSSWITYSNFYFSISSSLDYINPIIDFDKFSNIFNAYIIF